MARRFYKRLNRQRSYLQGVCWSNLASHCRQRRRFVPLTFLVVMEYWSHNIFLEHVTAVTVSVKDKLTLSLGVAAGSSIVGLVICLVQKSHLTAL